MNIKAVMLDFDGTSLQEDHVFISIRLRKLIDRLIENGIEVINLWRKPTCLHVG